MGREDDLLAACVVAPEDDGPRLVWADVVGGARGELVVIQCAIANGGLPIDEAIRLQRLERRLLFKHGAEWSGLGGMNARCVFRRGFVESLAIDAHTLYANAARIDVATPLLSAIDLSGLGGDDVEGPRDVAGLFRRIHALPVVARATGLAIEDATVYHSVPDASRPETTGHGGAILEYLVQNGSLGRMRALRLERNGVPDDALIGYAKGGALASLERLVLHERLRVDAMVAAMRAPRNLRALSIDYAYTTDKQLPVLVAALPSTLVELTMSAVSDEVLAKLSKMPFAKNLERLALHGTTIREPEPFAAFPRLRSLDLHGTQIGDTGFPRPAYARFAALELPSLRELWLDFSRGASTEIFRAFGPQLEVFATRGGALGVHDRSLVAGEVEEHNHVSRRRIFLAHDGPGEPWIGRRETDLLE